MRLSVDSLDEQEQDLSKPLLHDEVSTFPPSSRRWHTASNSGTFRRRASILAGGLGLLLMGAALDRAVISLHPAPLPLPPPPMPRHPSRNESRAALLSPKALPDAVANNRALSQEECDIGFPRLWPAVEQTRSSFAKGGILTKHLEDVEWYDGSRVAIIAGQLYVKRFHGEFTLRSQAILASLHEAVVTAPEPMPDVEFWWPGTDSVPTGPHFGLNRVDSNRDGDQMWLLPDFGLWSWPEPRLNGWREARRKATAVDDATPWSKKTDKLFWRGAFLSRLRKQLREVVDRFAWGDVGEINWGSGEGRVPMEDHCRHKYLASVEGKTAYSGRLKYLGLCHSVIVSHKMHWTQNFHGALDGESGSPDQNMVILEHENWDGLPEAMSALLGDQERAQAIADNAVRTLRGRHLTPAATSCYWRRVLSEYASVQRFTPSVGEGVDYESFMLMGTVHWDPHR